MYAPLPYSYTYAHAPHRILSIFLLQLSCLSSSKVLQRKSRVVIFNWITAFEIASPSIFKDSSKTARGATQLCHFIANLKDLIFEISSAEGIAIHIHKKQQTVLHVFYPISQQTKLRPSILSCKTLAKWYAIAKRMIFDYTWLSSYI